MNGMKLTAKHILKCVPLYYHIEVSKMAEVGEPHLWGG